MSARYLLYRFVARTDGRRHKTSSGPTTPMRPIIRFIVGSAATCLIASCSDVATSPTHPIRPAPSFNFGSLSLGTITPAAMEIGADGGSFSVGPYTLNFPANSICDPGQSTYGPTEWDKPCTTLQPGQTIMVFMTLSSSPTGASVDFYPALRFSPSTTVTLTTTAFASVIQSNGDYFVANPPLLNALAMYYAPSAGAAPTMDFAADPSLITHVNLTTGKIWRRVKHFSGYIMTSGEACTPSPDLPECVQVDKDR